MIQFDFNLIDFNFYFERDSENKDNTWMLLQINDNMH